MRASLYIFGDDTTDQAYCSTDIYCRLVALHTRARLPRLRFLDNTPDTRTQGRVEPLSIEGLKELGGKQCKATRRRHLMAGIATDCE